MVVTPLAPYQIPTVSLNQAYQLSAIHIASLSSGLVVILPTRQKLSTLYPPTSDKNHLTQKKRDGKALIPLPPTGFASVFCANRIGGANQAPAQARYGVCGAFGTCTVCKVLQRNVMRLRGVLRRPGRVGNSGSPGPLGRKAEKQRKTAVFKIGTVPKVVDLVKCGQPLTRR